LVASGLKFDLSVFRIKLKFFSKYSGGCTNNTFAMVPSMWPKARGLAQHGGPPGWLEESDPARE
jgi:hypothetical protein